MPFPSRSPESILFLFAFNLRSDKIVASTLHLFNVDIFSKLTQCGWDYFSLYLIFLWSLTITLETFCFPARIRSPPGLVSADISLCLSIFSSRHPWLSSTGASTAADESSAAPVLLGAQIVPPPPPSVWAIRDYIQQYALLSQGREPEGSGGGGAFLQRRPGEAFLWPPRDWPWQLRRCLLCTAHCTLHRTQSTQRKQTLFGQHVNKMWRRIECTRAVECVPNANQLPNAVRRWRWRCQLLSEFYLYLITCCVVLSE